jgi:hypothetical protein
VVTSTTVLAIVALPLPIVLEEGWPRKNGGPLSGDCSNQHGKPPTDSRNHEKGRPPMMRDDLLNQLSALPPDVDIGIQIGEDHLDIADLVPWGDGGFVALKCHSGDLRDLLSELGMSAHEAGAMGAMSGAATPATESGREQRGDSG